MLYVNNSSWYLFSAYYVPSSVLGTLYVLIHLTLTKLSKTGITFILQMKKVRQEALSNLLCAIQLVSGLSKFKPRQVWL